MEPVDRLPARWPYSVSRQAAARVLEEVEWWLSVDADRAARRLRMSPRLVRHCLRALQAASLLPRPGQSILSEPAMLAQRRSRWLAVSRDGEASALHAAVQQRGEARIQELAADLGMGRKQVRRSLWALCGTGAVRRSQHYHPRYQAAPPQENKMGRSMEQRNRLLDAVQARPGISKRGLCEQSGLSWGTVFRHVRLLEEQGVLETRREGGEARLFPVPPPGPRPWTPPLRAEEVAADLGLRAVVPKQQEPPEPPELVRLPTVRRRREDGDDARGLDPEGPAVRGILSTIGGRPGITREGIQDATGFSRPVVEAALGWLLLRRLVVRRGERFWPHSADPAPSVEPGEGPAP